MNGISYNLVKKSVNIKCYKSLLMKFLSLQERSLLSIHDPTGVKLLTRLGLKYGQLNKHKFCHNFKDTVVPMSDWGTETEITEKIFLRCSFFIIER